MDRDRAPGALRRWAPVIVAALCVACAALGWVAWRLDSRVDALEERLAAAGGGPGGAMSRSLVGAQAGTRVEPELFRGLWLPTYGPVAEERCWRGFTTSTGAAPPDPVHFYLSLGAAGEVTRVEPDLSAQQGTEIVPGFPECLAQIIRGMRFPPTGEAYVTRVQADRPRPASRPAR
jgi:hypothetical protein